MNYDKAASKDRLIEALAACHARLETVTAQRDILARYVRQSSEIDQDLCFDEAAAGRCPYRCHYGPTDPRVCTACIVRNVDTLARAVRLWDDGPDWQ